jgi:E3 ubiquitin-protein ligase TRIP12
MAKWICHTERGWVPYSDEDSTKIDASLKSKASHVDLDINGNSYRIEFATMNQINRDTGVSRNVQRISSTVSEA